MKRTHEVIEHFTLRDPEGKQIQAMRVAAAMKGISMNEWMLTLIRDATIVRKTP